LLQLKYFEHYDTNGNTTAEVRFAFYQLCSKNIGLSATQSGSFRDLLSNENKEDHDTEIDIDFESALRCLSGFLDELVKSSEENAPVVNSPRSYTPRKSIDDSKIEKVDHFTAQLRETVKETLAKEFNKFTELNLPEFPRIEKNDFETAIEEYWKQLNNEQRIKLLRNMNLCTEAEAKQFFGPSAKQVIVY